MDLRRKENIIIIVELLNILNGTMKKKDLNGDFGLSYRQFVVLLLTSFILVSCATKDDIDSLEDRLNKMEEHEKEKNSNILSMIQSVTVIPSFSNGSVGMSDGATKIRFEILPLKVAKLLSELDDSIFSIKTVSTGLTRSGGSILPIKSVKFEDDEFVIETSGESLPTSFFYGMEGVSCRLKISDGKTDVSSSYFGLVPDNTTGGFFFRLQDLNGVQYTPFLADSNSIYISIPKDVNLSALYPVFTGKDIFKSNLDFEITGKQAFDFSDFTKPVVFKQVLSTGCEKQWTVNIYDLPVMMMDTPEKHPINSHDVRVEGTEIKIIVGNKVDSLGTAGVRGRGNSTWQLEKKPYNIKLDKKHTVLGMESNKSWILLANAYYDRTQLHNATAFEMARLTDYPWVQSGTFIELFINGEHRGLYYLCEKVKEGRSRINIGDGYLLETELSGGSNINYVISDYFNEVWNGRWILGWEIKAPEDYTEELFGEIKSSLNLMESLIKSEENTHSGEYRKYYDIETAINWLLVEEVARNEEASRSKNVYMYKDDSGKFKMGPPWDFDAWTFGLYGVGGFYCTSGTLYYNSLLKDPYFVNRLKEKWAVYKHVWMEKIPIYIDSQYQIIRRAAERNDQMWPEWCPENMAHERTYRQSVDAMKDAFVDQVNWMDAKIQNGDFSND